MRSISLLILTVLLFACSDPIFWVLRHETVVPSNNLPKEAMVTGVTRWNNNYYAAVGSKLWVVSVTGGQWSSIAGLTVDGLNGVVVENGKLLVGTGNGFYESSDGTTFVQGGEAGKSTAVAEYSGTVYKSVFSNGVNIVNGMRIGSGQLAGAGIAGIATHGAVYSASDTVIYKGVVGGYSGIYLYADEKVGEYTSSGWGKTATTETGDGSTVFAITAYGNTVALYAPVGRGYYEVYSDNGGVLRSRLPEATVADPTAYEVSDLARSRILGFYYDAQDHVLFAMTSNIGLWKLKDGIWSHE